MKPMTLEELRTAGHDLTAPFELNLVVDSVAQPVRCVEVLRWLPGRRLVARIDWPSVDGGESREGAVLKLFIDAGAQRYLEREQSGLKTLRELNFQTPEQLARVSSTADAVGLVFAYLSDSAPLSARDAIGINTLVWHLAKMHEAGVWHQDFKLDNFLLIGSSLRFVDGDAVRSQTTPLVTAPGLNNLARLLAERPPAVDDEIEPLARCYFAARGWPVEAALLAQLEQALAAARSKRVAKYLQKTLRDCSEFVVERDRGQFAVRLRRLSPALWQNFSADPDRIIAAAQRLKDGNSATVVRWRLPDGSAVVIKRYNVKSWGHRLRRSLRLIPRYRRAWQNGHRLRMLEIPTAQPLALLERRLGPIRGVAYLLMEDIGDETLAQALTNESLDDSRRLDRLINEAADLFVLLRRLKLRHGDGKASNFLVHQGQLQLIDLDSMRPSAAGWAKDVARFLDNWPTPLHQRFSAAFRQRELLDAAAARVRR